MIHIECSLCIRNRYDKWNPYKNREIYVQLSEFYALFSYLMTSGIKSFHFFRKNDFLRKVFWHFFRKNWKGFFFIFYFFCYFSLKKFFWKIFCLFFHSKSLFINIFLLFPQKLKWLPQSGKIFGWYFMPLLMTKPSIHPPPYFKYPFKIGSFFALLRTQLNLNVGKCLMLESPLPLKSLFCTQFLFKTMNGILGISIEKYQGLLYGKIT